MINIKRVYEVPTKQDGIRILVDRLWPRGLTKEPNTELRKWFGHDPAKWAEFKKKYLLELKENKEMVSLLKEKAKHEDVTLLYAAKDQAHNEALVLLNYLIKE
ncbi:MAG TPA: DUF488 family protein [Hanamia sp.]